MKKEMIISIGMISISSLLFCQVSFTYSNFTSENKELTLLADAAFQEGVIRLTESSLWQIGACWYTENSIDPKVDFTTSFTFRISDYWGSEGGADGLALILMDARLPITVTDAGEFLGYDGIIASLAVEFDTYFNLSNQSDPNNNHVSVHSNGPNANSVNHAYALGTMLPSYEMKDGNPHTVTIDYLDQVLKIYLDEILAPILSIDVDIDALLELENGPVNIGFTSATGGGTANHDILNWSFTELQTTAVRDNDPGNVTDPVFDVSPNPFTSSFKVAFRLEHDICAVIEIQNINGQVIRSEAVEPGKNGRQQVMLDATALPKGIYFCVLKTSEGIQTRKMIKL